MRYNKSFKKSRKSRNLRKSKSRSKSKYRYNCSKKKVSKRRENRASAHPITSNLVLLDSL